MTGRQTLEFLRKLSVLFAAPGTDIPQMADRKVLGRQGVRYTFKTPLGQLFETTVSKRASKPWEEEVRAKFPNGKEVPSTADPEQLSAILDLVKDLLDYESKIAKFATGTNGEKVLA